jgi:hypothetical protein
VPLVVSLDELEVLEPDADSVGLLARSVGFAVLGFPELKVLVLDCLSVVEGIESDGGHCQQSQKGGFGSHQYKDRIYYCSQFILNFCIFLEIKNHSKKVMNVIITLPCYYLLPFAQNLHLFADHFFYFLLENFIQHLLVHISSLLQLRYAELTAIENTRFYYIYLRTDFGEWDYFDHIVNLFVSFLFSLRIRRLTGSEKDMLFRIGTQFMKN